MISKYSLWNVAVFGGGGGGGGGDTSGDVANKYNAPIGPGLENSPGYSDTPKEITGRGQEAVAQPAGLTNDVAMGQPPATTEFTTAAFPGSIVPTGIFTGYPSSNNLTNQALAGSNSSQVAGQALDAMGAIPSPQMAADLAAMGGVSAPGTPMPIARPADASPEYSKVDFSGVPSFAQALGTGPAMVSPVGTAIAGEGPSSPLDYKTAEQAFNQAVQNQNSSDYGSLMAAANGEPAPTSNILSKIADLVVPKAKADENPPELAQMSFPGGVVPMPPTRPADVVAQTPPAPAPAPTPTMSSQIPLPPSNPAYSAELAKAETAPVEKSPFETAFQSIVNEAPKNLTNTAVGFIPGVGLINTVSGLLGGPTVGGALFPKQDAAASTDQATPSALTSAQQAVQDKMDQGIHLNTDDVGAMSDAQRQYAYTNGLLTAGVPTGNFLADLLSGKLGYTVDNVMKPSKNGPSDIPPVVTAPVVSTPASAEPTATTPTISTTAPSTLASNFKRSYVGAPNNPLRYGYGPEANYYTTAAKGGMISPLNRMRDK